jgi:hypothetical protein
VTDNDEVRRDGEWVAERCWIAEVCAEQPEELEPLFSVNTEQNAATLARIHNENLAELKRLRSAVDIYEWAVNAGYAIGFRVRPLCPNLPASVKCPSCGATIRVHVGSEQQEHK